MNLKRINKKRINKKRIDKKLYGVCKYPKTKRMTIVSTGLDEWIIGD